MQISGHVGAVGQGLPLVGGGDERGHTLRHHVLVGAHTAHLHVALGEHTLDLGLLAVGLGVVLVDVHQGHAAETYAPPARRCRA